MMEQATPEARPAPQAMLRGTGLFVRPPTVKAAAPVSSQGEVTLNFVNADVRDVARSVLGDALHLNYVVDPRLQATITVETSRPLPPQAVLPALETILRASGVAVVPLDGTYRLEPLEDAARGGALAVGVGPVAPNRPGYGIQVLPLKFISAAEMAKIIEPFLPPGAVLQTDPVRNLLIVSGTRQDLDNFADLANTFDVDLLAGMSVGIFPLQLGSARTIATELGRILNTGNEGALAGLIRIVPIERLNSILVISHQPAYLERARAWIERLDYGSDQNAPQLFQYFVQNSRASDLAKVLGQIFSAGTVRTVTPQTAPGTAAVELGQAFPGSSSSGPTQTGTGNQSAAAPSTFGNANPAPLPSPATTTAPSASTAPSDGGPPDIGGPGFDLPQVRIVADEKNNALIILARPRDYRMVETTIKKLDIAPLQVVIEATIAEVTLNDELQFGLQYFFTQGANHETLGVTPLTASPIGGVSAVFPGFNYVLSGQKNAVVLNALSSITHVNVLSAPEIMVLDHQSAVLQVGDQVPVPVQQQQSVVNTEAPVVNSIDYRDTGVILRVSPRVNAGGLVTLDISQEVSDVTTTTSSSLNAPTIEQRRIQSTVSVQDGETLALGGLITDSKTHTRTGIPLLGSLPVVGALFRSTDDTTARTELLVLLSPHVVRNLQEAREATQELRRRMHGLSDGQLTQ